MAAAKKSAKAAASESAAATAEAKDEIHKIEFAGLELVLPPKLRESVIWRFGVLREGDIQGVARLVEAVIGRDQFDQVLSKMDETEMYADPEAERSPMIDLLEKALEAYGLTPGESPASNGSS